MSVWEHLAPSYRGEIISVLAQQLQYATLTQFRSLWDYTLCPDEKLFPGVPLGNRAELLEKEVDVSCDGKFALSDDMATYYYLKMATTWLTEDKGLYLFAEALMDSGIWKLDVDATVSQRDALLQHCVSLEAPANYSNPKEWYEIMDKLTASVSSQSTYDKQEAFLKRVTKARFIHSYVKHIRENRETEAGLKSKKTHKQVKGYLWDPTDVQLAYYDNKWVNCTAPYKIAHYRGVYYVAPEDGIGTGYCFTSKDFSRLITFITTRRNAFAYAKLSETTRPYSNWNGALRYLLSRVKATCRGSGDIHRLCEAWGKANAIMLSKMAGPLAKAGTRQLEIDFIDKGYDKEVDLGEHQSSVTCKNPSDTIDCCMVHRILPPPAYDPIGIFSDELALHRGTNPTGKDISEEAEQDYLRWEKYMRFMFIRAFQKKYGYSPGSIKEDYKDTAFGKRYQQKVEKKKSMAVNFDQCHMINLRGCLPYKHRDDDYHLYFEDTGFCPDAASEIKKVHEIDKKKSNQLLYMLYCDTPIDLRQCKKELAEGKPSWSHNFRVGYKCEAAKSASRLFFIGDMTDKILFQELEENISEFITSVDGNAIGISDKQLIQKMAQMVEQANSVADNEGKGFISYDIKAWSPHMSPRFQRSQFEFWAEVFNQPHVGNLQLIYDNAVIYLSTLHWYAKYKLQGANLEGMNGKMLTFGHVCVMGSAVLKAKEKKVLDRKEVISLLALIDDGLASVIAERKRLKVLIPQLAEINRLVYQAVGLEMKLSKSFLSDRMSVFLNLYSFGGAKVMNAAKVFIKLGISNKAEHVSMPERLREIHSWTLSANKNGANWYTSHLCYLWECIRLIYAADRESPPMGLPGAFQLYMPVALGGYGIIPFHLCNATVGRLPISEAVTFLRVVSKALPDMRYLYGLMLNKSIRLKTGASIIRSPQTFQSADAHLVEMRMTATLERHVSKLNSGCYVGELFTLYSEDRLHQLGQNLIDLVQRQSLVSIDRLYNCTPERAISTIISKFRKSSSVTEMLGKKTVTKIIKLDRSEVLRINRSWAILTTYL